MFILQGSRTADKQSKAGEDAPAAYVPQIMPGEIRLQKELQDLDLPDNVKMTFPTKGKIMIFNIQVIPDDEDCLWKGAKYDFTITVPGTYPHDAPKAHCNTKIYHPNIDLDGNVCLNILRKDWKPILCINAVIMGLLFLFLEPNPDDPLNHEAAEVMRDNFHQFKTNVRETLKGRTVNGIKFTKLL